MLDRADAPLTASDLAVNLADIQGGLLKEYDTLACIYLFYRMDDRAGGREWLTALLDQVTTATDAAGSPPPEETLNVAFSARGLAAVGTSNEALATFPQAFLQGMAARAETLGDTGAAAPNHWEGGLGGPEIHAMVVLSGPDAVAVDTRRATISDLASSHGVVEVHRVAAEVVFEKRSGCPSAHFGYRDPISQPAIAGFDEGVPGDGARDGAGWRAIQPGEFLLGYVNELGEVTSPPLPRELGLNGSFIVFRKARQDVAGFRDALKQGAMALWGTDDPAHQELLAAKIVGRWRSGCPIALSPDQDDLAIADDPARINDFDHSDDPEGLKCPLGAHTRRANPRASKLTTTTNVNRKRLLRRGLEFGPPLPEGVPDDGVDRGQAGVFVVADIELQFEFIQAQWIEKGDFIGLDSTEKDPLVGANADGGQFTVPGADMPFLYDLRQFVTVQGGEYFFAPSITGLRGLAAGRF